jgi:hypothetical protein
MRKAWVYIAFNLLGVILGLIIGVKWLGDKTVFKGDLRIKQRGRYNTQQPTVSLDIEAKPRRIERLQARAEKKKARIARRLKKKL